MDARGCGPARPAAAAGALAFRGGGAALQKSLGERHGRVLGPQVSAAVSFLPSSPHPPRRPVLSCSVLQHRDQVQGAEAVPPGIRVDRGRGQGRGQLLGDG
jgi:hypothetical protein